MLSVVRGVFLSGFTRVLSVAIAVVLVVAAVSTAASDGRLAQIGIVHTASIVDSPATVGISDNDLFLSASNTAVITRHLDALQTLGVKNIRLAIPWSSVETARGQYSWTLIDNMVNAAAARSLGIIGVVNTTPAWARGVYTGVQSPPDNPADFGNFMGVLAARYRSAIAAYEVWNEPNSILGYQPSPDPAGYTALLRAAYPAVKAAAPTATVIGGVLGATISLGNFALDPVTFLQQMYSAGARGYFDALSFHPYQNSTKFSQGASLGYSPLNQVTAMRQLMVNNGDTAKKIWATEYGLATSVVGDQQQSDFINDFLTTWRTLSYAGPAFVYTLVDRNSSDTTDPESTFGIYRDNWTPKPAAAVVR